MADYHEKGQWQGYIYYYRTSEDKNAEQPQIMTLNTGQIAINGKTYRTEDLRFVCDSLSRAPCSFDKFKSLFLAMKKKFILGSEDFMKDAKIKRRADQCIIISILEEENNILVPHLICTYVQDQMGSLKIAVKLAFQERMKVIPLGDRANLVNFGEDFDIVYSVSEFFVYKTKIFMNPERIDDQEFKPLVQLKEVSNTEGQKCKVDYPVYKLYKSISGISILNSCCIQFRVKGELWNMCSLALGDCVIPIKGIGNFIQLQCNRLNKITTNDASDVVDMTSNESLIQQSTYQ